MQFVRLDSCQEGRIADLPSVEVKDREHRTVADRIEKLIRLPRRRERACFRLAVTDDAGDDQIRVVEGRTERVTE